MVAMLVRRFLFMGFVTAVLLVALQKLDPAPSPMLMTSTMAEVTPTAVSSRQWRLYTLCPVDQRNVPALPVERLT